MFLTYCRLNIDSLKNSVKMRYEQMVGFEIEATVVTTHIPFNALLHSFLQVSLT